MFSKRMHCRNDVSRSDLQPRNSDRWTVRICKLSSVRRCEKKRAMQYTSASSHHVIVQYYLTPHASVSSTVVFDMLCHVMLICVMSRITCHVKAIHHIQNHLTNESFALMVNIGWNVQFIDNYDFILLSPWPYILTVPASSLWGCRFPVFFSCFFFIRRQSS